MFTQLLSQPPIPLGKAKPNLEFPERVEHTVMKALSRQPSDRYPDVVMFADALRDSFSATGEKIDDDTGGLLSRVRGLFRR